MTQIRYEIVPRYGGWSIACDGMKGPPYMTKASAVRDARWTAQLLQDAGEEVELYLQGRRLQINDRRSGSA